jgi:hypothetical protein
MLADLSLDLSYSSKQCCGSGRFLTGSGSDFQKRPDSNPDPDLNKFSAKFLLTNFLKVMTQKVKKQRFLKNLWRIHNKKVDIGPFIKARIRIRPKRSGSDQKDPDPTKKVRIRPDPDPVPQHWFKAIISQIFLVPLSSWNECEKANRDFSC